MTPKENIQKEDKTLHSLEEICENTRAIRKVVNRILDHLHETAEPRIYHKIYLPYFMRAVRFMQ